MGKLDAKYKYLIYAVVIILALVVLAKVWKAFGAFITRPFNAIADSTTVNAIVSQTGTDKETAQQCLQTAATVHTAFHASWDEDEDTAINAMNDCDTAFKVKLVCSIYQQAYGISLKSDFDKYVTWTDLLVNPLNSTVTDNWN
jgi:hypothetical protein